MSAEPTIAFPAFPASAQAAGKPAARLASKILFEHRCNNPTGSITSQVRRSPSGKLFLEVTQSRHAASGPRKSRLRIAEADLVDFFRMLQSTASHLRTHRQSRRPAGH